MSSLQYQYQNMSHIELVATWTWAVIAKTFATKVWIKSIAAFFLALSSLILNENEMIIWIIFLLYVIDLFLWVAWAIYNKDFSARKFFMWATKFLAYGVFMVIWVALWQALNMWNFFLSWIMAFCVITDSASILENLDKLGYNTPMFLKKYIISAKEELEKKYSNNTEYEKQGSPKSKKGRI